MATRPELKAELTKILEAKKPSEKDLEAIGAEPPAVLKKTVQEVHEGYEDLAEDIQDLLDDAWKKASLVFRDTIKAGVPSLAKNYAKEKSYVWDAVSEEVEDWEGKTSIGSDVFTVTIEKE